MMKERQVESFTDIVSTDVDKNRIFRILGCDMQSLTMTEAINDLNNVVQNKQKCQVTYLNADCLNKALSDIDYRNVIAQSERVFPDGIGVKIACKITGQKMRENINGTDMFPELCELSVKQGYRLFFLGAKPGVVDAMKENVEKRFPGIQVVGIQHGFFSEDKIDLIIDHINISNADLLFIAMGAPTQEKWIRQHIEKIDCSIILGVGGLFDFNAGRISRAPLWVRRFGFEWIWRLLQEPKRMWKRYLLGNGLFVYRVLRYGKDFPKKTS
ncbi:MAG: N-acetylglucosaminyldiphosphoundecaprenol N-acetyl-beta-D-mannosaminyltransferase [Cellvibrionaceae bacterium]|jgi:N-acetylglucosaminyldiphosphoundecaprenol N-acetyl-beta-D-mannosaminyltransferase